MIVGSIPAAPARWHKKIYNERKMGVKHLGDITAIDWSKVEPVDCVCGGSPCQDLSVAGKRAGLAGERSGLFMEQIRCVKELRKADELRGRTAEFIRPRYMVWENVPGAFSSGTPKGADFAAVIEEIIEVAEPRAAVSVCVPDGGWTKSGCYYAQDGSWSIAWRVHDAQFWGVPQRRKRISLVADFGGLSAPEVLFERKGLRGYFEEGGTQREGTAVDAESGAGADDRAGNCVIGVDGYNQCSTGNVAKSMTAISSDYHHVPCVAYGWPLGFRPENTRVYEETATTICNGTRPGFTTGVIQPVASGVTTKGNGDGDTVSIITGDHESRITDYTSVVTYCIGNGQVNDAVQTEKEICKTLNCMVDPMKVLIEEASAVGYEVYRQGGFADYVEGEVGTLRASGGDYGGGTENLLVEHLAGRYIVRRLTPLECERLQGYPDGWTDIGEWTDSKGKKHKEADSPRYKALGNSIALPFWKWLLKRISAQYERDATLGSLFDGIGGFPLCWEQINGKGTARWASEIEEFPIAVTKIHFPEVE